MSYDSHLNRSGFLDADHYKLYWEDWGNRDAQPIFYLHGGPGGGFSNNNKTLFDPEKHHVIFHDQRGCGRGTPFADTRDNTTHDLVKDIDNLRKHLSYNKIRVVGGSWGSALTLFYTLAYPQNVEHFVIWSVFLARQFEVDFVNEGYPKYYFPNEWDRFRSLVPEEHQKDGDSLMQYYAEKIMSDDKEVAKKYAEEWAFWEMCLCSIEYDPEELWKEIKADDHTLTIARLETHYFLNKSFVPEGYVLDSLHKIRHIPATVIQGRFDFCTPPISAYDLKKAYGDKMDLIWVNSGHLRTDTEMTKALKKVFMEKL